MSNINIPEYNVSEFNKSLKEIIESNFNYVRIRGEISEIKTATKGQIYLTLKDEKSILSGVIWENKKKYLDIKPEVGLEIIATGKITTWSKFKTTYQIDIDRFEIAGEGALLKLIEERKKRLNQKGFFDTKYKKNLPFLPVSVGIITSPTGSVIYDIINRIKERFPIKIYLWPVSVQGSDASNSIIEALKGFNNQDFLEKPEVIIIARGGGSTEDLMAFNDENLAIEIFNSNIPIISAIGHETDNTIADFVSDLRASTPTAAAEILVPMKKDVEKNFIDLYGKIDFLLENNLNKNKDKIFTLSKFLKAPEFIIKTFDKNLKMTFENLNKNTFDIFNKKVNYLSNFSRIIKPPVLDFRKKIVFRINEDLTKKINNKISYNKKIYNELIRLLNSNSISSNLKKGYILLSKSKKILKRSYDLEKENLINIQFYDKKIKAKLKKIN